MPEDDPNRSDDESVVDQLQQAHTALSDAKGARDAGLSDIVIVNRCYYACFHAAQAILLQRGQSPDSHGGVLSLFGSEVVLPGDATRTQGRFLNRLAELRKQADYGYGSLDVDVDELLTDADGFVEQIGALCRDL